VSQTPLASRLDQIEQRLDTVSAAVAELLRVQTQPGPRHRRRVRLTAAQRRELERERAFQMRVAKAAKRAGLSVDEFQRRYPGQDRVPAEAIHLGRGPD